jgi:phosphatidylglycerophosphate synthase
MTDFDVPPLEAFFAQWQVQHNAPDLDPRNTTALRLFLTVTYRLARPFARRRVSPNAITMIGLALAGLLLAVARPIPALAGTLVLVSALTDGVDGAVAALSNRASRIGFVLDSAVDRLSDACFIGALVLCGARVWLCAAAVLSNWFLEYVRARAGNAGIGEVGVVTIGERPTRVIAAGFGLIGYQTLGSAKTWPLDLGAALITIACVIGVAQLALYLRRALTSL